MLSATAGVNTHKGAIFTLGLLCGAVGRLWRPEAPCREPEALLAECAALASVSLEEDLAVLPAGEGTGEFGAWSIRDPSLKRAFLPSYFYGASSSQDSRKNAAASRSAQPLWILSRRLSTATEASIFMGCSMVVR